MIHDKYKYVFIPLPGTETPKALHVSPFMDMRNVWRLRAADPSDRIALTVGCTHPE